MNLAMSCSSCGFVNAMSATCSIHQSPEAALGALYGFSEEDVKLAETLVPLVDEWTATLVEMGVRALGPFAS